MSQNIPICFYPMQKIIIDDDQTFTQSILLRMFDHKLKAFNSPTVALNYLKNIYKPTFSMAELINVSDIAENTSTQQSININIEKLKLLLANKHITDLSVLLIDYHMPEMYGTEFLKEIAHLPLKKALITGEKDYSIGINAFNDGLVDAYIRKDDPNFLARLQTVINELEWKYFVDLSKIISELPYQNFKYLHDENFIKTLMEFIRTNNIVGFCMIDMQGSFLTKDSNDNYKYFLVRSREQLNDLSIIAKEDGASTSTISSLENANAIPYFYENDFWKIPGNEWDAYLHKAKKINESSLIWTCVECE